MQCRQALGGHTCPSEGYEGSRWKAISAHVKKSASQRLICRAHLWPVYITQTFKLLAMGASPWITPLYPWKWTLLHRWPSASQLPLLALLSPNTSVWVPHLTWGEKFNQKREVARMGWGAELMMDCECLGAMFGQAGTRKINWNRKYF